MAFDAGSLMLRIEARDTQLLRSLNMIEGELKDARNDMVGFGKGAQDALDSAGRKAAWFGTILSKTWDTATMGLSFLLRGLGTLSKSSIAAASDAAEVGSKFDVVFGDQAGRARQRLDEFGASVGRSRNELAKMAAGVQDTLVPLGFSRDMATDLSIRITKLATDLASFNNTTDEEAMQALQSAMIGNADAVRKYGVIITEATLNQQLMKMGVAKGTQAATEQEKALARLQMILAGTSDAQGDAQRTAGSFANQSKALWAVVSDLGVEFGNILVPAVNVFIGAAKEALLWVQGNMASIQSWGQTFAGWATSVLESVNAVIAAVMNYDLAWQTLTLTVEQVLTNAVERVSWFATNAWELIRWFFTNFDDIAFTMAQNFVRLWKNTAQNFSQIWQAIWQMLKTGGRQGAAQLTNIMVQTMTQGMKQLASSPELKAFQGTDFTKRWDDNAREWDKRMAGMAAKAKQTGKDAALDIQSMFKQLDGGSGGKGLELKASIVGTEELFKKALTARFEDSDAKKSVRIQEATQLGVETLVKNQEKQNKEIVEAIKGGGTVSS